MVVSALTGVVGLYSSMSARVNREEVKDREVCPGFYSYLGGSDGTWVVFVILNRYLTYQRYSCPYLLLIYPTSPAASIIIHYPTPRNGPAPLLSL